MVVWAFVLRFRGAVLVGLLTGLLDVALVQPWHDRSLAWFVLLIPLTWIVWCALVRALFLARAVERLADGAVFVAGPGLLLLSRGGPPLMHASGLSMGTTTALCLGTAVIVALVTRNAIPSALRQWRIGRILIGIWLIAVVALFVAARRRAEVFDAHSTAASGSPNVVLIFLDTLRYDDALEMPNLTRFGSAATVFESAWSPAPWTIPSHFGVLTGVTPWSVPFDPTRQHFTYDGPTLAQRFAARGYATAAIFANPILEDDVFRRGFHHVQFSHHSAVRRSGLEWLLDRSLIELELPNPLLQPEWMKASEVTTAALDFVGRTNGPYFLALNYMDAHSPYYIEPSCRDGSFVRYTPADWKAYLIADSRETTVPPAVAQRLRGQYRAAIRCLDRSLGTLLDQLSRTPHGQRTVVVIVGDHGEQFGVHGVVGHGRSLYRQVLHVPLIVKAPGQPPSRIGNPVTTLDIYDQLTSIAQGREPALDAKPHPVLAGCIFSHVHKSAFCLVAGRYHLIRWADGREELYDVHSDAEEKKPLPMPSDDLEISVLRSELRRQDNNAVSDAVGVRGIGYLQ